MDYKQNEHELHNNLQQNQHELHDNLQQNQLININSQTTLSKNNQINSVENLHDQYNQSILDEYVILDKNQSNEIINDYVNVQRPKKRNENLLSSSEKALNQFRDFYNSLEENRDESDKTHTYLPMVSACWRVLIEWDTQGGAETKKNIEDLKNAANAYLDKHSGYAFSFRGKRRKKLAQNIVENVTNIQNNVDFTHELDSKVAKQIDVANVMQTLVTRLDNKKAGAGPSDDNVDEILNTQEKHLNVDVDEFLKKYDPVTKQRIANEEHLKMINTYTTYQQVREMRISDLYKLGTAYATVKAVTPEFKEMIDSLGDIMKKVVIPASVGLNKGKDFEQIDMISYLGKKAEIIKSKAMTCANDLKAENSVMKKDADVINAFIWKLANTDLFNMIRAEVLTSRANTALGYTKFKKSIANIEQVSQANGNLKELMKHTFETNDTEYMKLVNAEVLKDIFDLNLKYAQIHHDSTINNNEDAKRRKVMRLYKEYFWKKEEELNRITRLSGFTEENYSIDTISEFRENMSKLIDSAWNNNDLVGKFDLTFLKKPEDASLKDSTFTSPNEYETNLKEFFEYYRDFDNTSLIQKMDDVGILTKEIAEPDIKLTLDTDKSTNEAEKKKLTQKREKKLASRMRYINSLLGNYRAPSEQSLDALLRRYRGTHFKKSSLGDL